MLLRRSESDFSRNFIRGRAKNGVSMNLSITGLHHVTAIASDPQRNLDFYVGLLGLRLVKRTVNFDDPASYHFYFCDAVGTPGSILTFFSWPGAARGSAGRAQVASVNFAVPPDSLKFWKQRLAEYRITAEETGLRFGEAMLRFRDPDGLLLELSVAGEPLRVQRCEESPIPAEHEIAGFGAPTLCLSRSDATENVLNEIL